jgi:sulfate permease, SulP family
VPADRWRPHLRDRLRAIRPEPGTTKTEIVAGLPGAISSVPDGMASAVIAGVNPVFGLYASAVGPVAGGLTASTRLMVITTTTAAALAAGSALSGIDAEDKGDALVLLTVLAGVAMIVAGLLRLGRYTRFVSHSVMIGFLTGVAVNIIFGQLPDLLGVSVSGSVNVQKAWNAIADLTDADLASVLVGLAALAILIVLSRSQLAIVSAVIALVIPSVAVIIFGLDSVARVEDGGDIPSGFPLPRLPDLGLLSADLIVGAVAIAVIVLVQGAGVAESAPNRDGPSSINQDFNAQGIANVASGLFRGMPVGGSVGQTALNVAAGGRTRWASIYSGLWMVVILVLLSQLVGEVAMPTLAAVLIFAAYGSLRFGQLTTVMRASAMSRVALITTFIATLLLPVAAAVGVGVALSLMMQLNREALDLAVVQRTTRPDGTIEERPAPSSLRSGEVTTITAYGSLLFAGARTLQARLPDPAGTVEPVVVLRLRGRTSLGATFIAVLADYAKRLHAVGGKLYLSGVDDSLMDLLERTGQLRATGPIAAFPATRIVGESTAAATADATAWLVSHSPEPN